MITFTVLAIVLLALVITTALIILAGASGFIVVFGDLLVCGLIMWALIKLFRRKK